MGHIFYSISYLSVTHAEELEKQSKIKKTRSEKVSLTLKHTHTHPPLVDSGWKR